MSNWNSWSFLRGVKSKIHSEKCFLPSSIWSHWYRFIIFSVNLIHPYTIIIHVKIPHHEQHLCIQQWIHFFPIHYFLIIYTYTIYIIPPVIPPLMLLIRQLYPPRSNFELLNLHNITLIYASWDSYALLSVHIEWKFMKKKFLLKNRKICEI